MFGKLSALCRAVVGAKVFPENKTVGQVLLDSFDPRMVNGAMALAATGALLCSFKRSGSRLWGNNLDEDEQNPDAGRVIRVISVSATRTRYHLDAQWSWQHANIRATAVEETWRAEWILS